MVSKIYSTLFAIVCIALQLKAQAPLPTNVTISVNGIVSSSVNYCAGTNLVLEANANCPYASGSSLFSYTWSGGPGTVVAPNKFSITPTSNVVYTVTAVPTFTLSLGSCTSSTATISVKYIPQTPSVVQLPALVCADNSFNFTVQNPPGPNNSYTYGWQTSLDFGNTTFPGNPSPSFSGSTSGTYTVSFTSTSPAGCTGSLTGPFVINTTPCNNGTIHSSANLISYSSTTLSIQNDVDVVGSINLNQCNVYISPNKKITVKNGSVLTINGSWLHGCSCPWEGIIVEPGAKLFVSNASVIEDANNAITSIATSATNIINVSNTLFNKCNVGVDLISSAAINMNSNLIIRKSIFSCRNIASNTIYNNITNYNALHANFELALDIDPQSPDALSMTNLIDNVAPKTTLANGKRSHIGLKFNNHSIATINPLREINIFDNMDYGVYAQVSSINIQTAHFMNMPGNNIDLDGIAVYSVDPKNEDLTSQCIVNSCLMNNVCRGVHVENIIDVTLTTNNISSNTTTGNYNLPVKKVGQYGVYYSFFAKTPAALIVPTKWKINANSIRNHFYGVAIIRNNYLGASENNFECNTIFGSQTLPPANPNTAYCTVGLYINDGVGNAGGVGGPGTNPEIKGEQLHISGNDIVRVRKHALEFINVRQNTVIEKNENDIANSAFGAYILNSYGPLGFALRDNVPLAATVSFTDCRNILLQWNNILGYPLFVGINAYKTTGIKCTRSQVRIIKNTIARNQNDIWFLGNCNPSVVAQNEFFYATNALYFSNDAQIGQQGNSLSPAGNVFTSSPFGARVIWETNMANATTPASFSTFFWSNVSANDEKMPNNRQTVTAPATAPFAFNNSGNGLIRVNVVASLLVDPPTVCGAATPIQPPIGEIDSLNISLQDSIVLTKKLILDDLSNQTFAAEKWWNNKLEALILIESNPNLLNNDAVIAAFYNNNQQTDLGKLNKVYDYAKNGQTQLAASVNNNVAGLDINENYRKAINTIYLQMANDSLYVPDSLDLSALDLIANSCPEAYGKVVNEARNLLMGLQKQVIDFVDNCNLQNVSRFVKVTEPKNAETINQLYYSFNLYPNPNNGNFTLQSLSSKEARGTVQVTDILGKTIIEQVFTNKAEISISDTNSKGIYFIKVINEENKTTYTGKVIVH